MRAVGNPPTGYMSVRSQHNATFYGAGAVLEKYDGTWRKRSGNDDGALYKVQAGGLRTYPTARRWRPRSTSRRRTPTTPTSPTSGS